MSRVFRFVLIAAAFTAMWPAAAGAQALTACKKVSITPNAQQAPLADGADPAAPRPWIAKADATFPYVTITCDSANLFAEEVEFFQKTDTLKASGHVTFIDGSERITADRLEFNTKTKLGTFWNAQGIMQIAGKPSAQSVLGATEADAYFYGETIEIIGPQKYRLHNGKFTTCVQPTPRWEMAAENVVIVKDRRAVMRNMVVRVKDVPVFYLPYFYYPINKEDRATGFLMPNYGNSTYAGRLIGAGFFWAMNRSMDTTLRYQFTSKAGKGYGGEYRYVQAPGSEGNVEVSVLSGSTDASTALPRSFTIRGSMVQQLPARLQFRSNVNYTNSILSQQTLQQDISQAVTSSRTVSANITGSYGRVALSGQTEFTDYFSSATTGSRTGSAPRITANLAQAPIGSTKIYFGATSEFVKLIRQTSLEDPTTNTDLSRLDFNPTARLPISNLPFLPISATAGYRFTSWSESLNASGTQVPTGLTRQLFDVRLEGSGPKFTRIFDTPGNGYATRWKHLIEPTFSVAKSTTFEDFKKVVINDYTVDNILGSTQMSYGLRNSLLAKRPGADGAPAQAQEIASFQLQQTYYTNSQSAALDTSYQTAQSCNGNNSKLSPMSGTLRVQPSNALNVSVNAEYSTTFHAICSTSVGAGVNARLVNANVSWSKLNAITLSETGVVTSTSSGNSLNTSAQFRTYDNHFSGSWSWSYDVLLKRQLSQRYTGAYMAQCCGIAIEYQVYNFGGLGTSLQQDKRFNISFSLAGVGTFTNLLGAFGR